MLANGFSLIASQLIGRDIEPESFIPGCPTPPPPSIEQQKMSAELISAAAIAGPA